MRNLTPMNLTAMKNLVSICRRAGAALVISLSCCGIAIAQQSGGALPWEGPLQAVQASLTGPVAKAIGVVALAVCGGMLAFGGELSDFTKRILMVVLALSVMLMANSFMNIFG
jgi:type IV secretory pathway VirB2 component (pilin)